MLPFTSLDGASATGPGTVRDLEGVPSQHSIFVAATGSPSELRVLLEGSHDGTNFRQLAQVVEAPGLVTVQDHLVRYVRANLEVLIGGTSPTVTATIAST